ncbi:hypothetical protein HCN44_006808 [Aphidius gifuensis]|uniref:Uncharacterized protein n=1 Tax=Aphidius gifuensis TaxID=684658 RepID=A0A834Y388_APHGI|nr:uncharacterized protein LOC122849844 [Aphidius gifuensis]XP_044004622.1 uncharacterized protein LOC122849844 [Aphidius gifuensis]KAF7995701.1 hypothetical protein HCN44_006808 [Aphidius gifuensis]
MSLQVNMLGLVRQPLLKSVKIAQFGVKKFAQPIPRVLKKSFSEHGSFQGWFDDDGKEKSSGRVARLVNCVELKPVNKSHYCWGDALRARNMSVDEGPKYEVLEEHNVHYTEKTPSFTDKCIFYQKSILAVLIIGVILLEMYVKFGADSVAVAIHKEFRTQLLDIVEGYLRK